MSFGKIVQLRVHGNAAPAPPGTALGAPKDSTVATASQVTASQATASQVTASLAPRTLETLSRDIQALQTIVATWGEHEQTTVRTLERALDALHKEAFTRLIRALKVNPAAALALRDAAADEVVYAVLRHHEILRASLQERVEAALDSVRPQLASHGGNVELNAIEPPDAVSVRLLGACDGCSAAGLTMKAGVEKAIMEHCPEIRQVRVVSGQLTAQGSGVRFTSPFALGENTGWVAAVPLEDIPEGGVLALELSDHSLLLSRRGVQVSCFENACAHLGMPLDGGEVSSGVLTCPHHGFRFSLESGECLTVAEVQLQTHAARVYGARVEVRFS